MMRARGVKVNRTTRALFEEHQVSVLAASAFPPASCFAGGGAAAGGRR
jgi:hypothetical protein